MIRYAGFRPSSGDGFVPATELAAAVVDARGTVTTWSPGAQALPGYSPEDIVGRATAELLEDGLPDSARRHLADRQAWIGRVLPRDQAGRTIEAELRACPLLNGKGDVQWFLHASVPQESDGPALALQRSLLQHHFPAQQALETAARYLPADPHAGVGGDWFDVIALSGVRMALGVGDVVGHGLNASAAMGRLRTAVRTLADVDLPRTSCCLRDRRSLSRRLASRVWSSAAGLWSSPPPVGGATTPGHHVQRPRLEDCSRAGLRHVGLSLPPSRVCRRRTDNPSKPPNRYAAHDAPPLGRLDVLQSPPLTGGSGCCCGVARSHGRDRIRRARGCSDLHSIP